MARMMTFVMLIAGMMMMLNLSGISSNAGYVLGQLGLIDHPENFQSTGFWVAITAAMVAFIGTSAIRIGTFGISNADSAIVAGIASAFGAAFLGDIVSVIIYTKNVCGVGVSCQFIYYIIVPIMGVLLVGYAVTLVDWIRGTA